jgi:hypothetical protein
MLFIIGGYDSEANLSPDQIQDRIQKYRDWSSNLSQGGKLVDANKITDNPHVLVRENGQFTIQQPALDESTIGGYFVIEAQDYDEAIALSKACPIFEHGGSLEIRQIES